MSAEVQWYEQPRSHFEITQSPLELSGFLVEDSGYEIGSGTGPGTTRFR